MPKNLVCEIFFFYSDVGNLFRFMSHSCDPNCETHQSFYKGIYVISIAAKREIRQDEELTIDYNWTFAHGDAIYRCSCESTNCRRIINLLPASPTPELQQEFDSLTRKVNFFKSNVLDNETK